VSELPASNAVILSDMGRCTPPSALSPKAKAGHWKVIPYELMDGTKGQFIWASMETGAPVVKLPLGVTGWHAIFVGLYRTAHTPCLCWLKLDGDLAPQSRMTGPLGRGYWGIEEVLYKAVELKEGANLHISQQFPSTAWSVWNKGALGCGVAYVKLVPLTGDEIASIRADRSEKSNRRLAATCDGFSGIATYRLTTAEDILKDIELFRNTDFGTLLLHVGGSEQVGYPSQYGSQFGEGMDDFVTIDERYYAEACRILAEKKLNPTKVLIDGAHDIGMKVHVGIRPAMWSYYEPLTEFFESPFYRKHPAWRTVDRDGTPVARMSWAVPEVRRHLLDILREAVGFGADGAHIVFNRGFPVVLYEQPFVALFQKQHGEDPRQLPECDARITQARSDIVTTFVKELRMVLDEEQARRGNGKRLEISLCVLANESDNLQYGLDIRRLVEEGLIDELYPVNHTGDFGSVKRVWDFEFFQDVCGPKNVPVFPTYSSAIMNVDNMVSWAKTTLSLYEAGASGIAVWDVASELAHHMRRWSAVSRFGHIAELESLQEKGLPDAVHIPIRRLGDTVVDTRYPPFWGG